MAENLQQQADILIKLAKRVEGFTRQRAGTHGYSLKVNNMARAAEKELIAAGTPVEAAHELAWKTLGKAQIAGCR